MALGSKETYTDAQQDKAQHITKSYEAKGVPRKRAEQIGWATVNKQSGGGERSGSGATTSEAEKSAARRDSAHNAADTRAARSTTPLEHQSIAALRAKARKKHISGRSTMNKVELIMALRQAR